MKKIALATILLVSAPIVLSATGKEVYEKTCIVCHGANGKGAIPGAANFTDPKGPLSQSDEVLLKHIANGYQKPGSPMAMPAKGGNASLTDEEVKNTLKYIRDTFGVKK